MKKSTNSVPSFAAASKRFCCIAVVLSVLSAVQVSCVTDARTARIPVEPSAAESGPTPPMNDGTKEVLRAPPPNGWRQITQLNRGDTRLLEFEPPATSTIARDETLRLESFRRDPLPSVTELLNDISGDYKRRCSKANVQLIRQDTENGFPIEVRLFTCPGKKSMRPPLQMVKAIRGDEWFYIVSRSSSAAIAVPEQLSNLAPRIAAWSLYMRDVSLCTNDAPQHPCAEAPKAKSRKQP